MSSLIILILLTINLGLWFKKILDKDFKATKNSYEFHREEQERLLSENIKLKQDNLNLEKILEMTMALYDITKDICKSLDIDEVFANFSNELNKYIKLKDCRFLKTDTDLSSYKDYTVLLLQIDTQPIGYLAADGVRQEDKDKFHILTQQFILGIKRAYLYQRIQELAIMDSLTQVFSRRYCLERFSEEVERSKKFKYRFSFIMIDIDHFKEYNDRYGHLVGDMILREASYVIKENIRQIDLMGRYGGEEFCVILPETDKEGAQFAAERFRQAIEQRHIRAYDEELKVTISIGIATFPDDAQEPQTLIDRADWALYRAKQTGRNRVCVYGVYE